MLIDDNLAIFLATPLHFQILNQQGRQAFAAFIGCSLAEDWPVFDDAPTQALATFGKGGEPYWGSWIGIDLAQRSLIAFGGFGGAPDSQGRVLFGYAIAREWRGRGLGVRYARLLTRIAFADHRVRYLEAHTLADAVVCPEGFDNRASIAVLQRLRFVRTGEGEEDGMRTLIWNLSRADVIGS